ncbi:MAG: hypothetical protein U5L04_01605 [Trueperaceae bacterium]|nr:hypothetical protein [Trueperaceae bacterium]
MCITPEDFEACETYQSKARKYDACLTSLASCEDERNQALKQRDENFGRYQEADRLRRQERALADSVARKNAVLGQEVNRRWKPGKVVLTVVGVGVASLAGGYLLGTLLK